MVPKQGNVLYVEQTLKDSIFIRIMLLLMLGLLYFLFYLMATSEQNSEFGKGKSIPGNAKGAV